MIPTPRRLRPLAWLALWAFVGSFVLPVAGGHPVGDDDDGACLVSQGWTTRDAPQLRAFSGGDSNKPPDHCVFCHWLRAMSGAVASDVVALAAPALPSSFGAWAASRVPVAAGTAGSSRAPPTIFA